ncbi:MAG: DMT family transporter [Acidimicrobiales bacterium]
MLVQRLAIRPSRVTRTPRARALAIMFAAVAVGSCSFTLIDLVLRHLSPSSLAAGRVVFSALAFVAVVVAQPHRRTPIARGDRLRVVLCGLGGSAGFHLLYSAGQHRASVAASAVVLGTMPAMTAIGEWAFLGHRLTRRQMVGVVCSVLGIVIISWGASSGQSTSLVGIVLVAAATLVWSAVTVATRSVADRYDSWWLNTPGTVLGALVMLVVASGDVHEFASLPARDWLLLAWLGAVSSAFIYAALAMAMQALPATSVASLGTLVTPIGIGVAWAVLDQPPSAAAAAGSAVVVLGVVLVTRA